MRKPLLAIAVMVFGWSSGASAVPVTYYLDSGATVGSALIFTLYADDGVATAEDTSVVQPIPSGSISGDFSGVNSPRH